MVELSKINEAFAHGRSEGTYILSVKTAVHFVSDTLLGVDGFLHDTEEKETPLPYITTEQAVGVTPCSKTWEKMQL